MLQLLHLELFFPARTLFHAARARSSGATAQPGPASHRDSCDWPRRAWARPSAPGRPRSTFRLPGSPVHIYSVLSTTKYGPMPACLKRDNPAPISAHQRPTLSAPGVSWMFTFEGASQAADLTPKSLEIYLCVSSRQTPARSRQDNVCEHRDTAFNLVSDHLVARDDTKNERTAWHSSAW